MQICSRNTESCVRLCNEAGPKAAAHRLRPRQRRETAAFCLKIQRKTEKI